MLVVDDNRDAAESLALLLQMLGATTRVESSGEDALRAMSEFRPALAIVDIGMPGMDGHEVARRIRARPEFDAVSLVALTGWGQAEDRRLSMQAGLRPPPHQARESRGLARLVRRTAGIGDRRRLTLALRRESGGMRGHARESEGFLPRSSWPRRGDA